MPVAKRLVGGDRYYMDIITSCSQDMFRLIRGDHWMLDGWGRVIYAHYCSSFHGDFWVEVAVGDECTISVEKIGDSSWVLKEMLYRRDAQDPSISKGRPRPAPPDAETAQYVQDLTATTKSAGTALFDSVYSLNWSEPTPNILGLDGVTLSGGIAYDDRRQFATWSPQTKSEPAKCAFFWNVWCFARDHSSHLEVDVEPIGQYLSEP